MKKLELFVVEVLGKHGYEAVQNAAAQMPEIVDLVPAQAILSWVNIASQIGYEGVLPSTGYNIAFAKNETGYGITLDGNSAHVDNVRQLATVVADALGFIPSTTPTLAKGQMDDLVKTIDLLTKYNLVKAMGGGKPKFDVGGRSLPHPPMAFGEAAPRETVQPKPALSIPKTQVKGQGTAGVGGTSPKKMTTVTPPMKQAAPPKAARVPKAPAATKSPAEAKKSEPKIAAIPLEKTAGGCPRCGTKVFSDEHFVGCECYGELAKSTYSKRINGGHVVFFNYQWTPEQIQLLIQDYRE
jgi:hypothetical protein